MAGTGIVTPDNPRGYLLIANGEADYQRGTNYVVEDVSKDVAAVVAQVASAALFATSTTEQTVGTGTKTFVVQANRGILTGTPRIRISYRFNHSFWMEGIVTSYSSIDATTANLQMSSDKIGAVGTYNDWIIGIAGEPANKSISVRSTNGSTGLTMLSTDRDVSVISSSNKVFTLLDPAFFVLGDTYKFRQIGAATLTIQGTVYDAGGEVSSMVLTDGEMLALCRYTKLDGSAGLCIDSQGA